MGAPKKTAVTAPPDAQAKALPRRPALDVPTHCPEPLRQALARVGRLADGLRRTEAGFGRGTYLANQVTACLLAWRSDEITSAIAVAVLERLDRTSRGDAASRP